MKKSLKKEWNLALRKGAVFLEQGTGKGAQKESIWGLRKRSKKGVKKSLGPAQGPAVQARPVGGGETPVRPLEALYYRYLILTRLNAP